MPTNPTPPVGKRTDAFSTGRTVNQYGPKDRLSDDQMRQVLSQAGFSGQGLENAMQISRRESGYRPMALNDNVGTGDNSYGLFQINMLGNMGKARQKQYGLSSYNDLYDPLTNAKVAYNISKGGTNWSPWSTSKSLGVGAPAQATPPAPSQPAMPAPSASSYGANSDMDKQTNIPRVY